MPFKLKMEPNRSQEPVPAGKYFARIVHLATLGEHKDSYEGKTVLHQKIGISYEIVGDTWQENNNPWVLAEQYNMSTYQKSKLYPVLKACFDSLGKELNQELNLAEMLDKPVSITVVQKPWKDTVFCNVIDASAVPEDAEIPEATTELLLFNVENFNDEVFSKLPRRFRKMISERIVHSETKEAVVDDVTY